MYNENSILVKIWVKILRKNKDLTIDKVPNIGNLKDVITSILEKSENK